MNSSTTQAGELHFGFLSVYPLQGNGVVGALLVLNRRARPLEFHCTVPLLPNRTQQILYGTTFESYWYGEEIAAALVKRARVPLGLILTNVPGVLAVRGRCETPVILLEAAADPSVVCELSVSRGESFRENHQPTGTSSEFHSGDHPTIQLGDHAGYCHDEYCQDLKAAEAAWSQSGRFDLSEPFQRLREAVEEAHRAQAA